MMDRILRVIFFFVVILSSCDDERSSHEPFVDTLGSRERRSLKVVQSCLEECGYLDVKPNLLHDDGKWKVTIILDDPRDFQISQFEDVVESRLGAVGLDTYIVYRSRMTYVNGRWVSRSSNSTEIIREVTIVGGKLAKSRG